jgi:hypothetical protein
MGDVENVEGELRLILSTKIFSFALLESFFVHVAKLTV